MQVFFRHKYHINRGLLERTAQSIPVLCCISFYKLALESGPGSVVFQKLHGGRNTECKTVMCGNPCVGPRARHGASVK